MRVAITILSNRGHNPAFTRSLTGLLSHINAYGRTYGIEGYATNIAAGISLLPKGRQDAIKEAQKQGMTHMLCLDDDMEFLPDVLKTLASRNVKMIGVNYARRSRELLFVAIGLDGKQINSKGKTGIEEISHIGMGIFLLEIASLPPPPNYAIMWNKDTKDYDSEDTYFCEKARKHGVKVYVDHDASQKIGHIGDFTYTMDSFPENKA